MVVAALGCSSGQGRIGRQPSWRQGDAAHKAQDFAPIVFAPQRPGVDAYNTMGVVKVEPSDVADGVAVAALEVATRLRKPIPKLDARLSAAAAELARVAPPDSQLAYPLVEFALQRYGIIEPSPHIIVIWSERDGSASDIVDSLRERLPEILDTQTVAHTRLGVGVADRKGEESCVVVAFQASYIDTKPVPRSLPVGGRVDIVGTVQDPYTDPQVFVTRPDGRVARPTVRIRDDGSFSTLMECGGSRGRQQVEITAIDDSGSTVLANFPIWCGDAPPSRIVQEASIDDTAPVASEEEAVRRMLDLVNRDRRAQGLEALEIDTRLSAVARAHSVEMKESGRVAHVSPVTGSAADRVEKAGIRTAVVLENVARAYGVAQAEAGLMNSPGHRANILSREATHIGLGIVFGSEASAKNELFITQVFARLPVNVPAARAREIVSRAVKKARQRLVEDEALSVIAKQFATRIAAGESTATVGRWASTQLRQMRSSYLAVSTVITAVADVTAFDPASAVQEPAVSHFGVGVARGDHEVMGDDAFYIVLLLAEQ